MYIRKATLEDDFDMIASLYLQTWQATYRNILPKSTLESLSIRNWNARLKKQYQGILLSFTDNNILMGVISLGPARKSEDSGYVEIYSIYVLPKYQAQHVGSNLIKTD